MFFSCTKKKGPRQSNDGDVGQITEEDRCRLCKHARSTYIRRFNYKNLPPEYFHQPDDTVKSLLIAKGLSISDIYPEFWIHLPKDLKPTKYTIKVCESCYKEQIQKNVQPWNTWESIYLKTRKK